MITVERQLTSKLIALSEDSTILGYTQTDNPKRCLRELIGGHKLQHQVRIYEICPIGTGDISHYYDFDTKCLLSKEPSSEGD